MSIVFPDERDDPQNVAENIAGGGGFNSNQKNPNFFTRSIWQKLRNSNR